MSEVIKLVIEVGKRLHGGRSTRELQDNRETGERQSIDVVVDCSLREH